MFTELRNNFLLEVYEDNDYSSVALRLKFSSADFPRLRSDMFYLKDVSSVFGHQTWNFFLSLKQLRTKASTCTVFLNFGGLIGRCLAVTGQVVVL